MAFPEKVPLAVEYSRPTSYAGVTAPRWVHHNVFVSLLIIAGMLHFTIMLPSMLGLIYHFRHGNVVMGQRSSDNKHVPSEDTSYIQQTQQEC